MIHGTHALINYIIDNTRLIRILTCIVSKGGGHKFKSRVTKRKKKIKGYFVLNTQSLINRILVSNIFSKYYFKIH